MLNFADATFERAIIHVLPGVSEGLPTYSETAFTPSEALVEQLETYFKALYKAPEYSKFTYHNGDFILNPVYNYTSNLFDNVDDFIEQSERIAKVLYDHSRNDLIKTGELLVLHITNVLLENDEMTDAIALIKIESRKKFITVDSPSKHSFEMSIKEGINYDCIDKATLIFNLEREHGLKVLNRDKSNIGNASKYWYDNFLHLTPYSNEYLYTNQYIKLTASFIKQKNSGFDPEDPIEQVATLKKAKKYFEQNDQFTEEEFVHEVFEAPQKKAQFANYKALQESNAQVNYPDTFGISNEGLKKFDRVFKSVIKLDKNFHIYVHGDTKLIRKGTDESGKKYYQIFYEQET